MTKKTDGWIVVAQTTTTPRQTVTHYVRAGTEGEAKSKVQDHYQGDRVMMIAGKLSPNGFGVLKDRFGDSDMLDAQSEDLLIS
jgi:hypothetical protein